MQSFTNIEKLGTKNHYTGYGAGDTWVISKVNPREWMASGQTTRKVFRAATIQAISAELLRRSSEHKC